MMGAGTMSPTTPPYSYHPRSAKKFSTSSAAAKDVKVQVKRYGEILVLKGPDNHLKLETYAAGRKKNFFQAGSRGRRTDGSQPRVHFSWDFGYESLQYRDCRDLAVLDAVSEIVSILRSLDSEGEGTMMEVTRAATDRVTPENSSLPASSDITSNQLLHSSSMESNKEKLCRDLNLTPLGGVPLDREKRAEIAIRSMGTLVCQASLKRRERSSSLGYPRDELAVAELGERSSRRSPPQSCAAITQSNSKKRTRPRSSISLLNEPHEINNGSCRKFESGLDNLGQNSHISSPRKKGVVLTSRVGNRTAYENVVAKAQDGKKMENKSREHPGPALEVETPSHETRLPIRRAKSSKSGPVVSTLQLHSAASESLGGVEMSVPEVDEIFEGPGWRSNDQRRKVNTLTEQFRYLHELFCNKYKGIGKLQFRPDIKASNYLRSRGYTLNKGFGEMGAIPGVEIGDRFRFRIEMCLLGVHRPLQSGIDYVTSDKSGYTDEDGQRLAVAVSVVSSGGYKDNGCDVDADAEYLVYSGSGGVRNLSKPGTRSIDKGQDQELVRGNLALKNSCDLQIPIRVTRGLKSPPNQHLPGKTMYYYAGLYKVANYYIATGMAGTKVWKFTLVRQKHEPQDRLQLPP